MKPSLQFRLSQHLTLTPQLQQSIRLLQLSTVELNQEIERILMENPALEREEARDTPSGDQEAPRSAPSEPARHGAEHPGFGSPGYRRDRLAERSRRQLARTRGRRGRRPHARHAGHADAARPPAQPADAHQPRRARPAVRRAADRRARRGRLPDAAAGGDRGHAAGAASRGRRGGAWKSCRSRCATCSSSSPPASARARRPNACRCKSRICPMTAVRKLALEIVGKHLELLAARDYTRLKSADRRRRRCAARGAAADPGAQPAPGLGVRQARGALRDPGRDRARRAATCGRRASTPTPCRACASTACTPSSPPPRAAAPASRRSCRRRAG